MIVPDHWAEARRQHRGAGRQVTVRRFGWSNVDTADAQAMADRRAEEALARILAGEPLVRREPKVPYNGAAGVPIREEVLARDGPEVITRNAYGAHCLNSPRALFADVDFDRPGSARRWLAAFLPLALAAFAAGWLAGGIGLALIFVAFAALLAGPAGAAAARIGIAARGGDEAFARRRIARFAAAHPHWRLRLYRTPSGLRLLATHRPFDPGDSEVQAFFGAIGADPVYVRMCRNQHCFRARLTAKPWRIGIGVPMKPRPGVWPVRPERLADRRAWTARYDEAARGYAACRFIGPIGDGGEDPGLRAVAELHDRLARADRADLPIA